MKSVSVSVQVGGEDVGAVVLHSARAGRVDVEVDGVRQVLDVHTAGEQVFVDSALGATELRELPRYPDPAAGLASGSLTAPMPGSVVRVATRAGVSVIAGEVLLVLEAMKMEHVVRAPGDGTVAEVHVQTGQQVQAGALLVVLADPPSDVTS